MKRESLTHLSRRERQIMDVLYRLGEASVSEVRGNMPDPPGYSSVRTLLRVLEEKGYASHTRHGRAFVYAPTVNRATARRTMLKHLVKTFFDDSVEDVVAALISMPDAGLSSREYDRLVKLIERKRHKEKKK